MALGDFSFREQDQITGRPEYEKYVEECRALGKEPNLDDFLSANKEVEEQLHKELDTFYYKKLMYLQEQIGEDAEKVLSGEITAGLPPEIFEGLKKITEDSRKDDIEYQEEQRQRKNTLSAENLQEIILNHDDDRAADVVDGFLNDRYNLDADALGKMREVVEKYGKNVSYEDATKVFEKIKELEEQKLKDGDLKIDDLTYAQVMDKRRDLMSAEDEESLKLLQEIDAKIIDTAIKYNKGELLISSEDLYDFQELLKSIEADTKEEEVEKTVKAAMDKCAEEIKDFEEYHGIDEASLVPPEKLKENMEALDAIVYDHVLLGRQDIPEYKLPDPKPFSEFESKTTDENIGNLTVDDLVGALRSEGIRLHPEVYQALETALAEKLSENNIPNIDDLRKEGLNNEEIAAKMAIFAEALNQIQLADKDKYEKLNTEYGKVKESFEQSCPYKYEELRKVNNILNHINIKTDTDEKLKDPNLSAEDRKKLEEEKAKENQQNLKIFKDQVRKETMMYLARTTKGQITEEMFVNAYVDRLQKATLELTHTNEAVKKALNGSKGKIDFFEVFKEPIDKIDVEEAAFAAYQTTSLETMSAANDKMSENPGYEQAAKRNASDIKSMAQGNNAAVSQSTGKLMLKSFAKSAAMGVTFAAASMVCPPVSNAVVSSYFLVKSGIGLYRDFKKQKAEALKNGEKFNFLTYARKNPMRIASTVLTAVSAGAGITGAVEHIGGMIEAGQNVFSGIASESLEGVSNLCNNVWNNITGNGASLQGMWKSAISGLGNASWLNLARYGTMVGNVIEATAKAKKGEKWQTFLSSTAGMVGGFLGGRMLGAASAADDTTQHQPQTQQTVNEESDFAKEINGLDRAQLLDMAAKVTGLNPETIENMDDNTLRMKLMMNQEMYNDVVDRDGDGKMDGWDADRGEGWATANETQINRAFDADPKGINEALKELNPDHKWMNSADLHEMMEKGGFTDEQLKAIHQHAESHFDKEGHITDPKLKEFYEEKARIEAMRREMEANPLEKPVLSPEIEEALKGKIESPKVELKMPERPTPVVNPEDSPNRQLDAIGQDAVNGENSLKEELELARKMDGRRVGESVDEYMSRQVEQGNLTQDEAAALKNLVHHALDKQAEDGKFDNQYRDEDLSAKDIRQADREIKEILQSRIENAEEIALAKNIADDESKHHDYSEGKQGEDFSRDTKSSKFYEGMQKVAHDLRGEDNIVKAYQEAIHRGEISESQVSAMNTRYAELRSEGYSPDEALRQMVKDYDRQATYATAQEGKAPQEVKSDDQAPKQEAVVKSDDQAPKQEAVVKSDEQVVRDTGDIARDHRLELTDKLSDVPMSEADSLENNQVILETDELGNKHYIGKDADGNTFKLSLLSNGGTLEDGTELSVIGTMAVLDVSEEHKLYDILNNNPEDVSERAAIFMDKMTAPDEFAKDLMSKIENGEYKVVSEVGDSTNTTEQAPKQEAVVKSDEQAPKQEEVVKSDEQAPKQEEVVKSDEQAPKQEAVVKSDEQVVKDDTTSKVELPSMDGYKGEEVKIFNSGRMSPTQDSEGHWVVKNENGEIIGESLIKSNAISNAHRECSNAAISEFQYQKLASEDPATLTEAQKDWMQKHDETMKTKWGMERNEEGKLVKPGQEGTGNTGGKTDAEKILAAQGRGDNSPKTPVNQTNIDMSKVKGGAGKGM